MIRLFAPDSKKIRAAGIFAAAFFIFATPSSAAVTKKQFRQDLAFYRKTAQEKNLNANDRLFILNRLRDKYNEAKFDTTELYGEIDKWSGRRIKEWKAGEAAGTAAEAPKPPEAASPAAAGSTEETVPPTKAAAQNAKLSKILIKESDGKSQLVLSVPGLEEFKEVPVETNGAGNPSAAVVYLYNTKNALPVKLHSIKPKKGYIREVLVKRVTANPPTVKVSVAFRKNYPYDIERGGDRLILNVYNTAPQWQAQAPTPGDAVDAAPEAKPPEGSAPAQAPSERRSGPITPEPFTVHNATHPVESGQIVSMDIVKYPEFGRATVVSPDGQVHLPPAGQTIAAGLSAAQISESVAKKIQDAYLRSDVKVESRDFDSKTRVALIGAVKNEGVYEYSAGMGSYELIARSGGFVAGADKKAVLVHRLTRNSRKKLSFDVAAFAESAEPIDDFQLEAGDVVEVNKIPDVLVFGEVRAAGFYRLKEPATLTQMLTTAGGLSKHADPAKIFLIREEEGQNMKRAYNLNDIKGGLKPDPPIQGGDLIYSQPLSGKSKVLTKETVSWSAFFISLGLVLALLI